MKNSMSLKAMLPIYMIVSTLILLIAYFGSDAVTVMTENAPVYGRTCIVIDAGHGGIDGGATSCTGVLESHINLQIAHRINDLFRFMGYETKMIRTTDTSIYTEGATIAAQKVSDLKNRARIVNDTENAILLSIHQNTFQDDRYSGAQVFYAPDEVSKTLAEHMQRSLIQVLDKDSKRRCKPSDGIYLMQHIKRPGILVECGFLSNVAEDAKLNDPLFQKRLSCVMVTVLMDHIKTPSA